MDVVEACTKACKINRLAGELVNPTPATPIAQFIPFIAEAIRKVVNE